jgi:hypothetical protein
VVEIAREKRMPQPERLELPLANKILVTFTARRLDDFLEQRIFGRHAQEFAERRVGARRRRVEREFPSLDELHDCNGGEGVFHLADVEDCVRRGKRAARGIRDSIALDACDVRRLHDGEREAWHVVLLHVIGDHRIHRLTGMGDFGFPPLRARGKRNHRETQNERGEVSDFHRAKPMEKSARQTSESLRVEFSLAHRASSDD